MKLVDQSPTQWAVVPMPDPPGPYFTHHFPLKLFPGGLSDLVSALVECLHDADDFADTVFQMLEYYLDRYVVQHSDDCLDFYLGPEKQASMRWLLLQFHDTEAPRMRMHLDQFGKDARFQMVETVVGGVVLDVTTTKYVQTFAREMPCRPIRSMYSRNRTL